MVPPSVTGPRGGTTRLPGLERELRAPLQRFLSGRGYHVEFDLDGHDYFDAVARRGDEIGLVELKLADWRKVHTQALVRRTWADWVAVLLPRRSLAERAMRRTAPAAAQAVGLWYLEEGEVQVLREARPAAGASGSPLRQELRAALALREAFPVRESLELPSIPLRSRRWRRWDGRNWHLEEFEAEPADPHGAGEVPPESEDRSH